MSTRIPAAERAAVFIDTENTFGIPPETFTEYYRERMLKFFDGLPAALAPYGFVPKELWAAVRTSKKVWRRDGTNYFTPLLTPGQWSTLNEILTERAVTTVWCKHQIVDTILSKEVERRLKARLLPACVVLVTTDRGFTPLVRMLRDNHHFVAIVGHRHNLNISPQWETVAQAVIPFDEIVGTDQVPASE